MNSEAVDGSEAGLDAARLPRHVAIIMDGNGRWAKKRLLNRIKGHEKGADVVRAVVRACRELGIEVLTLYAFSTENWQRPEAEVSALMTLLKRFLASETPELVSRGIRLGTIGETERLPGDVQATLRQAMDRTRDGEAMRLNLALSYGGRAEIVRMVQAIARRIQVGDLDPGDVTADLVEQHLYTAGLPDPDLLIRTSGEMRISNFLLWQIAYAELYITPTLWPDFTRQEFVRILKVYQERDRRFGRVET